MATAKNRSLIAACGVEIVQAGADTLPYPDAFFDRAMAVHVIYFWDNMAGPALELGRVIKPGGRLVLLFRSASDPRVALVPRRRLQIPAYGGGLRRTSGGRFSDRKENA